MAYATQQDMLDRFGPVELMQLTDITQPRLGGVNATVLDRALGDASAEIDGYLVGRMALPLAAPPALLRVFCCDMARYRLMSTMPDERAGDAYKAAVTFLTKVAAGNIQLQAAADVPTPAGVGDVAFGTGSKVFGRETQGGDMGDAGRSASFWGVV
jgi:phage gp36-like protein